MDSRAASAGGFEATATGRFALRDHHPAPAIKMRTQGEPDRQRRQRRTLSRRGRPRWQFRLRGDAHAKRIDPDRLFDVLELSLAEIGDRHVEPAADLTIGVLGKADRAGRGDSLQPRGDVDAVAHEIAVALLDDVAQMNADAKLDTLFGRDARVALDHGVLHFERAAHRVDDAAELDDAAVAGALDDAAMMHGDRRINQIAAQRAQSRQSSVFVRARESAIADHIRD